MAYLPFALEAAMETPTGPEGEAERAAEDDGVQWAPLRRGWCLGSEEFKRQALARMEGKLGEHHAGEEDQLVLRDDE